MHYRSILLLSLSISGSLFAAEEVSLSGTVAPIDCVAQCGVCCGTHLLTDSSGKISFQVGNSFSSLFDLESSSVHRFTGRFYNTTGQCGVGECTLFQVESIDETRVAEPVYDTNTQELRIPSAKIENTGQRYQLILTPPFAIGSLVELTQAGKIRQGEDCSSATGSCEDGTTCLSYYGIAGANGPLFKTCEIPCSEPGAACPTGQACITIADGPGAVCRTQ